jgi:leucyl-tRNA synthetase
LERVWRLQNKIISLEDESERTRSDLYEMTHKVNVDTHRLKFNTAISAMMIYVKKAEKSSGISMESYEVLLRLLAPYAPHMTEELWMQNNTESIHISDWPKFNNTLDTSMKALPIQINGKVRAQIVIEEGESKDDLQSRVLEMEDVKKWTDGNEVRKFIHVPGKIINLVI